MPLSADEIVKAINEVPGITADAITKTLMIGGLSTQISAIDDAIANAQAAKSQASNDIDAKIKELIDEREKLVAARQALGK